MHAGRALGEAAARQLQVGAHEAAARTHGHIAQRGHDLQQHARVIARQAHASGGGVDRYDRSEGLPCHVHAGRRDSDLGEVAAVVQRGEDQGVGGQQARAAERDALAGVGAGQAGVGRRAAGRQGGAAGEVAAACGEPLQAERVSTGVAGVVARVGNGGVVAAVGIAADTHIERAARWRDEARGRVGAAGTGEDWREHLVARRIEDAQVGVAHRVGDVQRKDIACGQVHAVQVHVQHTADAGVDLDALVDRQPGVQCGGDRVAHVSGRAEVSQRGDRGVAPAQRAVATRSGHRDQPGAHAGRHGQGDELLVDGAVHHRAHGKAAHAAAVDRDGQVIGRQARAFEHDGVARNDAAAHGLQRGHDLQGEAGAAAQHGDRAAACQRRHRQRQRGAAGADRAGAREGAQRAAVIDALELHQRAAGEALAGEGDGLAGVGRRHHSVACVAVGRTGRDPGEHAGRLHAEVGRDLRVATFGGDADRAVQGARGHDVVAVVACAGDVERAVVGGGVGQCHAADGDGGGTLHEARADQIEGVVPARAAIGQA